MLFTTNYYLAVDIFQMHSNKGEIFKSTTIKKNVFLQFMID